MRLLKLLFTLYLMFAHTGLIIQDVQAIQIPKGQDNSLKIGLLIPDQHSRAARSGAELAIHEANKKGGFNGKSFQLIVRSLEGPWGTGSKEAVNLLFNENVWAIIGSHDGRNAHLVEQVCVKVHAVFLSAWTGDPTLSEAFIPWFFNCVPNDLQQASSLIKEIYLQRKLTKIVIVSDNSYDAIMAMKSFIKRTRSEGIAEPQQFVVENHVKDLNETANQIKKANAECIVLFGEPSFSQQMIRAVRAKKTDQPIYCSLFALGENSISDPELIKGGKIVRISSGFYLNNKGRDFSEAFKRVYGSKPNEAAAYAYDATNLIMQVIRNAAGNRDKIKDEMVKIHYNGVTGLIEFDQKGNRKGEAGLIELTNGNLQNNAR